MQEQARPADIVKLEKNLNYISFFSPSKSRRLKADPSGNARIRTITYPAREIEGKTVNPKTTIKPDPQLGLPTTADRDKYMAFRKIVTDRKARIGKIENPVGFGPATFQVGRIDQAAPGSVFKGSLDDVRLG